MALSHLQARAIVQDAFRQVHGRQPSANESNYTQAVAWLENQYGRAGQFAAMAAQRQYNWGSLHARGTPPDCPSGSAPGSDEGKVCFQVFPTDTEAAAAFVRVLTKNRPTVLTAMSGSPQDVARAMRATGYYTAPEEKYAAAITSAMKTIGAPILSSTGIASSSALPLILAATGIAVAASEGWLTPFLGRLKRAL